ncbi:MAG: thiol reductant ABC exporter subunit CydC, partial [Beijerinckiaceae bacterium]|nr:thiol reductant ABC exporter subunit CydC [Beijerinckiaceae bacterium]
ALSTAVIIANVGLLALAGWFIAAMALAGVGGPGVEYFAPAAGIRALAILRTGGRYGERLVTHEATFRLIARLRAWFYEHLEPLAPARLQHYRGGDLLSRIRADIDSLDNLYLRVVAPSVAALISVVAMVAFLSMFSRPVAVADGAGLLLAGVALPLLAQRLGRTPGRQAVALRADLRAAVSDTVRGLGELVVCRADARQRAAISRLGTELVAAERRQAIVGAVSAALSGLGANLTMWLALVLAIPFVAGHALPGPDLAMIALFVLASFEAVAALPQAFGSLGETLAAGRRIFEIVDAAPAVTEPTIAATAPTRFDLRIEGLRMRYADDAPWALDGVDLVVPQGGSLGVVGPSGSGKSSLLNVLLRFWDYQEGSVAIGGVSLRDIGGDTMRSLCAVVSQQTHLFNTSVRDNLLLARPDADDARLHAALRDAALLDEILAMPNGLDTLVGETGTRLSGGQARRLALARAFLKDAPLVLLDEPTEGLDAASEHLVLQALATLMRDRTTILITHHPQALRLVDKAVKMDAVAAGGRSDSGMSLRPSRHQKGIGSFRPA